MKLNPFEDLLTRWYGTPGTRTRNAYEAEVRRMYEYGDVYGLDPFASRIQKAQERRRLKRKHRR